MTGIINKSVGAGILNAFDEEGRLLRRVWTGAPLAAPFAMLYPRASFGPLGGKFLVANYGDGRIWGFDLSTTNTTMQAFNLNNGAAFSEPGIRGVSLGAGTTDSPFVFFLL